MCCRIASVVLVAIVCLSSAVVSAQERTLATTGTGGQVDLERSRVYVLVGKTGLGHEHGVVGQLKSGNINLGQAANVGRLEFDMKSFIADTEAARKYVGLEGMTAASTQKQVNQNMLGSHVLNVEKFPAATFVIDTAQKTGQATADGKQQYRLKGQFTLHGTTRPITVVATAVKVEKGMHLVGQFSILQTDFNIKPYTAAFGTVGVADKLTIWGDFYVSE